MGVNVRPSSTVSSANPNNCIVVVDMQVDFVNGALGTLEAAAIVEPTFGSTGLAAWLAAEHAKRPIDRIEFMGLCTDICATSNALLIHATLPEVDVAVNPALCAGVTPASHQAALSTMQMCQIAIAG